MVGIISPCALVEIELTDLPKYGGVRVTLARRTTGLSLIYHVKIESP